MTQNASRYLLGLARGNAQIYVARCAPRAILLTGSSASGNADFYSDIDMIVYYDAALPTEEQLQAARADIGADSYRESYPRWEDHTCGETYQVGGVECQVGHKVVADLEERTLSLLDGHDSAELGMKAIMGLLSGIPLHGDEVIEAWLARAANFSDRLARGMVEHYLREIFPMWYFAEAMERRDCAAWAHQTLAQTALNVIGVLAGLNRQYYVPFQFKRARQFIETLAVVPSVLADRVDRLFQTDLSSAITQIEALVQETVALVNIHMPEADTSILRYPPGERQQPWRAESLDDRVEPDQPTRAP